MFDPWTLWVVLMSAAGILAAAMLFVWWLTPTEPALAHWAGAMGMFVLGTLGGSLRGAIPDFASIELGNSAILIAYGLIWTGLRRFDRRKPRIHSVLIAPAIWIGLCQLPLFADSTANRVVLVSVMVSTITLLSIEQLWRGGPFASRARVALLFLLLIALGFNLARIPGAASQVDGDGGVALYTDPDMAGMGIVAFAIAVFACFSLVLVVRERNEMLYRRAAQRDDLTGLLNRRGFMEAGLECCLDGGPVAVMLLDLDHFKQVNDRFGHPVGDKVLTIFARVLRESLRQSDVIGRIGGEEFAAVLPGALLSDARLAAERVQKALREAAGELRFGEDEAPLQCTASIGLAGSALPEGLGVAETENRLQALIAGADAVLYRAKSQGRDRIEIAPETVPARI